LLKFDRTVILKSFNGSHDLNHGPDKWVLVLDDVSTKFIKKNNITGRKTLTGYWPLCSAQFSHTIDSHNSSSSCSGQNDTCSKNSDSGNTLAPI
jgi:hypothetical protein